MEHPGAGAIARLTKRQAERLLDDYDDDPIAALTDALRTLTGRKEADWDELTHAATISPAKRLQLLDGSPDVLDALVRELNELRALDARRLAAEAAHQLATGGDERG